MIYTIGRVIIRQRDINSLEIFFFVAKKKQQQTTGNVKRNHPIESAIAHVLRNPIYIYGSCKDDIVGCKETEL